MRDVPGFERYDLPSGARYLKIHHYADPKKDEAWLEAVRKEMSDTPHDFRRQILMDEDVFDGEPVFPDYSDARHCPIKFRESRIPVVPRSMYVGGWDAGQTLNPAFVLLQITPPPYQVHGLLEVTSDGGESMETFAPAVLAAVQVLLPGAWDEIYHAGDATVVQRSGSSGDTAQQVARRIIGASIEPMTNVWAPRHAAVSWLLTDYIGENTPRFLLDGSCKVLRKGFQGAYHFQTSSRGDTVGAGRILQIPLKNGYSHPQDALQYAAMKARQIISNPDGARVHKRR